MDGPYLRSEPSTLSLDIVDGSILQDRTFHVNAPYHGWFSIQARTLHALGLNHGQFGIQGLNLPRFGPESWTVRVSVLEPSTLRLNITDGSYLRREPSTLKADIVDSSGTLLRFYTHNSNNRQASGPHPEPGAALSDCSRRRCFRGH